MLRILAGTQRKKEKSSPYFESELRKMGKLSREVLLSDFLSFLSNKIYIFI